MLEQLPADAVVMAWWDVSRRLNLLANTEVVFGEHLGEPLIVPTPWRPHNFSIERFERDFRGGAEPGNGGRARFECMVFPDVVQFPETGDIRLRYQLVKCFPGYPLGAR